MYANLYESFDTFAMHTFLYMRRVPPAMQNGSKSKKEPLALPLAVEPRAHRSEMADALAEALRSTQERALAISHQIRAAQKRSRRAHARVPVKSRGPRTIATAQVVYAMAGCMEDAAQAYVRQKRVPGLCASPCLSEGSASARAGIAEAARQRLLPPVTAVGLPAVAAA